MIDVVVWYLKNNGVVFTQDGAVRVPSWHVYRTYAYHKKNIDKVALAESILRFASPIEFAPNIEKCPQCKHYRQYYCDYEKAGTPIPPATFKNGCERFIKTNVYF